MGLRLGGERLCLTVYMVQMLTIKVESNYQIRTIHKKVTIKFGLKTKTQTQSLEVIQYHTTYYTQESNYQIRANNLSCLAVRLKLSIKHTKKPLSSLISSRTNQLVSLFGFELVGNEMIGLYSSTQSVPYQRLHPASEIFVVATCCALPLNQQ